MEIITVTIPNYIREIQLSRSQRAIYFEWDSFRDNIKAKNKPLLQKYIKDKNQAIMENRVSVSNLEKGYFIGIYVKTLLVGSVVITGGKPTDSLYNGKNYNRKDFKYYLTESDSKTIILANPNQVGQPNIRPIKGQDIYTGGEHIRAAVIDNIKTSLMSYVRGIPVITEFPIMIDMEIHDTVKAWTDNSSDVVGGNWDVDNRGYPYAKAFPDLLVKLGKIPDDDRLRITKPPGALFVPIEEHETRKLVFKIYADTRECIKNNPYYNGTIVREEIRKVKQKPKTKSNPQDYKPKELRTIKFKK